MRTVGFHTITARRNRGYISGVLLAAQNRWPDWCPAGGNLATAHPDPEYAKGFHAGWHGLPNPVRGAELKTAAQVRAYYHV